MDHKRQCLRRPTLPGQPRMKKKRGMRAKLPKNAVMQLNEMRPPGGVEFCLEAQSGPGHAPTFTMSVQVNGAVYQGTANTKKKAKLTAAEKALASFVQFRNASEAHQALGRHITTGDFTEDSEEATLFRDFGAESSESDEQSAAVRATTEREDR